MHLAVVLLALADIQGSGKIVEQARNVPEFSGLHVAAGISAKVTTGARSVVVRADDNVLPVVRTDVKGGQLYVGFEPRTSINTRNPVTVTISAPRLDEVEASGGSGIDATIATGDALRLGASGGSHVRLSGTVKPKRVEMSASGGGEIALAAETAQIEAHGSGGATLVLEGRAGNVKLHASGGTVVKAAKLAVGALDIEGSGGVDVSIDVSGTVRGSLSGGSTARVGPRAKVDVSTSGGSEVRR